MNKNVLILLLLVLALVALVVFALNKLSGEEFVEEEVVEEPVVMTNDPLNMTYTISGEEFDLVDGYAEKEAAPLSATKNIVNVLTPPLVADIDSDGDEDVALVLVNETGGSGTFYYGVFAINQGTEYVATNAMLLGDRVNVDPVEFVNGRIVYKYKDYGPDEDFASDPTVEKEVWVQYQSTTNSIGEWVKDFEGETDPSTMKLNMHTWRWQGVTYNDGRQVVPKAPEKFTLTFNENNTFSATTDCNGVGGSYDVKDKKIKFSDMLGTLMYCEGSQEGEFKKILSEADSYFFTSKGELIFDLKYDSGSAVFK